MQRVEIWYDDLSGEKQEEVLRALALSGNAKDDIDFSMAPLCVFEVEERDYDVS